MMELEQNGRADEFRPDYPTCHPLRLTHRYPSLPLRSPATPPTSPVPRVHRDKGREKRETRHSERHFCSRSASRSAFAVCFEVGAIRPPSPCRPCCFTFLNPLPGREEERKRSAGARERRGREARRERKRNMASADVNAQMKRGMYHRTFALLWVTFFYFFINKDPTKGPKTERNKAKETSSTCGRRKSGGERAAERNETGDQARVRKKRKEAWSGS